MTEEHITGETPIILPTPVAVKRQGVGLGAVIKVLAWATALCLSISVVVAFVALRQNRDDLKAQLACRAQATATVNQAITNEQIAVAQHSAAVGEFVTTIIRQDDSPERDAVLTVLADKIDKIDASLTDIGVQLQIAVNQQQASVTAC